MMDRHHVHNPLRAASPMADHLGLAGVARRALARTVDTVRQWRRLSRSRRELAALDELELKDMGLSRSQAQFESAKSFLQH
jgi:uncharacterized protein YjiS (DUF1127 family)